MLRDLWLAIRGMRRSPAFAALVIGGMALGIGVNTAMFSAVRAIFLKPLPFVQPDRLFVLWESDAEAGTAQRRVSPANFVDWRAQNSVFEEMGVLPNWTGAAWPFNVVTADGVDRVSGIYASSGFLRTLGVKPHLGRLFGAQEDTRSGLRHVLISFDYWQAHFHGDPAAVGRTLEIDTFRGGKFVIVGVLPQGFEFPKGAQVWLSLGDWGAGAMPPTDVAERCCPWYVVFARLKPGVSMEAAQAELTGIARRVSARHPQSARVTEVKVQPLRESLVGSHRLSMLALSGATGCILLIVCANVANLLLSRGVKRRREMATRMALGASRWRLVRQLSVEALLLCGFGAIGGLVLVWWTQSLLRQLLEGRIPLAEDIRLDAPALWFTLLLTLICGCICSLAPIVSSSSRLNFVSRGETETASSRRMRNTLVVAEVAIAVTLVVNAGLLLRTLVQLQNTNLGFSTASTLSLSLDLTTGSLRERGRASGFLDDLQRRVRELPGVVAVATTTRVPFDGQAAAQAITREGQPALAAAASPQIAQSAVSPSYFGLMGMRLLDGRLLSGSDSSAGKLVAVVNETAAKRYWPGESPVGKRFAIGSRERFGYFRPPPSPGAIEWREVVGVVSDVRTAGFGSQIQPEVYYSHQQFPIYDPLLLVRTAGDPMLTVPAIREHVRAVNSRAVIAKVQTLEMAAGHSLADPKLRAGVTGAFSVMSLLLGVLGIYGVMSYTVERRTREIGLRMALGADHRQISAMVMGQALRLTMTGVAIGLAAAWMVSRWASSLFFGVSPSDLQSFAAPPVLFALAAVLASYLPARRAMEVDPATALNSE